MKKAINISYWKMFNTFFYQILYLDGKTEIKQAKTLKEIKNLAKKLKLKLTKV